MSDFFAENNIFYFALAAGVLYLAYLQVFKGGVKKNISNLVDHLRGGGSKSKK